MLSAPTPSTDVTAAAVPDDGVHHYYCDCDPNLAFCGQDITDHEDLGDKEPTDPLCPMCKVLDEVWAYCPRCGAPL